MLVGGKKQSLSNKKDFPSLYYIKQQLQIFGLIILTKCHKNLLKFSTKSFPSKCCNNNKIIHENKQFIFTENSRTNDTFKN